MAKDFAKKFYDSAAWQHCRAAYIAERKAIDGGMCEVCHEQLGLIVHHKIWLTAENINDPEITLNHSNLRYECLDCHNAEEENGSGIGNGKLRLTKVIFTPEGDVLQAPL